MTNFRKMLKSNFLKIRDS